MVATSGQRDGNTSKNRYLRGKQYDADMKHYRSVGYDLTGTLYVDFPVARLETVWLQGSFCMMRGEMMKWIGLHDARYLDICSDSDYCFHALDRGWQVVFVPESSVIHIGNASFKEEKDYSEVLSANGRDIQQMIGKWTGVKFNELLKQIPVNAKDGSWGKVTYVEETKKCLTSV
jgi:Predicted glycosyltransferases